MPEVKMEVSQAEMDRRYQLLRERLAAEGLAGIIVYGGSQLGVPVHYLTGVWGTRNNMVIFPVEGNPVFLIPSNAMDTPASVSRQGCWIPQAHIRTAANLAAETARTVRSMGLSKEKLGIDSYRWWSVFDRDAFMEVCPQVALVEAHRLFGEIRGRKSPEELALINKAMQISDLAHATFLANLRSGLTEAQAARFAVDVLDSHGVGDRIILIHTRPEATYPNRPGPAVIQKPNPVTFSPEFTRQKGYGAQMIRAYWWEEPQGIYKEMFKLWDEMRYLVRREFRPGVEITDAGRKVVELIASHGFECDKLGHAVGLSYGDAPYLTAGPDEKDYMEWTIQENEIYAVHPMVRCKGYKAPFSMIGDMYFVGPKRTDWMTTTLPGLPEYIPD